MTLKKTHTQPTVFIYFWQAAKHKFSSSTIVIIFLFLLPFSTKRIILTHLFTFIWSAVSFWTLLLHSAIKQDDKFISQNMADNLPPPSAGGINKIVDPHEATLLHPAAAAAPVLSSNPKEAYFQLLRCWVQQASLAQNASACFPYYLMANYPHMYAASTGLMSFPQPFHAAAANAAAPGPADGNQQQLRMNINRLLDNPARNTESKMNIYLYRLFEWHSPHYIMCIVCLILI